MMSSTKPVLTIITTGTLLLSACASTPERPAESRADATPTTPTIPTSSSTTPAANSANNGAPMSETVTLSVSGMSCPQCSSNIERTLSRVKGVRTVDIDLGSGEVRVSVSPTGAPSRAMLAQAVEDAGFTVEN